MLYRMQGTEDRAQSAWRKAQTIAAKVTQRHPLHLFDCVQLHSLTQSWDLRTAGEVLITLAGRDSPRGRRAPPPSRPPSTSEPSSPIPPGSPPSTPCCKAERGRRFAEDYALCRQPPRELVPEFYRLLFEHYFLSTAFPQASAEQSTRVRQIADQLVTEMAMNPHGEMAHLHAYLRAWNDRAAAWTLFDQTYPYSPALVENMKWLLSMRQRQWIVKAEE
jgi:hypothetical protein